MHVFFDDLSRARHVWSSVQVRQVVSIHLKVLPANHIDLSHILYRGPSRRSIKIQLLIFLLYDVCKATTQIPLLLRALTPHHFTVLYDALALRADATSLSQCKVLEAWQVSVESVMLLAVA